MATDPATFARGSEYTIDGLPITVKRLLGKGSNGVVYAATLLRKNGEPADVALRVNRAAGEDPTFGRESALLEGQRIKGSNVPSGPFALKAEGSSYRASIGTHVVGQNLEAYFRAKGPEPKAEEVAEVMGQIGRTLNDAGRKGFAHLDIKPSNVMREAATGKTSVIDWELAQRAGRPLNGESSGTLVYMSPEMAGARGRVTPAMDVYSAGMTMARLANGRDTQNLTGLEDSDPSFMAKAHAIVASTTTVARIPSHPILDRAAQRATDPDPLRRGTALDLMTDLAHFREARKHYDAQDLVQVVDRLVARGSNWRTRIPELDANAARGLLDDLPADHPRRQSLVAIAELSPPIVIAPRPQQQPTAQQLASETLSLSPGSSTIPLAPDVNRPRPRR